VSHPFSARASSARLNCAPRPAVARVSAGSGARLYGAYSTDATFKISQQRSCDLLVAETTIMLEDRGDRERDLAPALIWFDQDTGVLEIEIEVFEISRVCDDRSALCAEVGGQIGNAFQPPDVPLDKVPVDGGVSGIVRGSAGAAPSARVAST
jgi:hypothetical protein